MPRWPLACAAPPVPLPVVRHVPSPARRPVIGVTLDSEPAGGYAKLPWYALRENYCDVVAAAGGLPIALPHEPDLAEHYLGPDRRPGRHRRRLRRRPGALRRRRAPRDGHAEGAAHPVRVGDHQGCRGARHAGAGHLRRPAAPQRRAGRHPDPAHPRCRARTRSPTSSPTRAPSPATRSRSLPGTLLHRITGADRLPVNSAHHQAAERVGPGIVGQRHRRRTA